MVNLLISLVLSFVMYILTPAQTSDNNTNLEDFNISTADVDRMIPVLFGTAKIGGANCTWYGDFYTKKVTQGDGGWLGTGIGEKEHETGQIRHFIGLKLTLAFGNLQLHEIHSDNYLLWENTDNLTGTFSSRIEAPDVYGDIDSVIGDFTFYDGTQTTEDPYLKTEILNNVDDNYGLDVIPAWNGTSFWVWKGGEVGLSKSLRGFKMVVSRSYTPAVFEGLGQDDISTVYVDGFPNYPTMNPVFIIYELMKTKDYGSGYEDADIDIDNFFEIAQLVYNEGWGLSVYIDTPQSVRELIDDILKYANLILRLNKETNKFELVAVRDDYIFDDLPVFKENNIIQVESYKNGGVEGKLNEVTLNYTSFDEFKAASQDFKNEEVRYQKEEITSTTQDYKYLNDPEMAKLAANREALPLTTEISEITMDVSFEQSEILKKGDVINFSFSPYEIQSKVFRIKDIEYSEGGKFAARINAMQDTFGLTYTAFTPSPDGSWKKPDRTPVAMNLNVIDAPRFFSNTEQKIIGFGENPKKVLTGYDLYIDNNYDSSAFAFTPSGLISGAYSKTSNELFVNGNLGDFNSYTKDRIKDGVNWMIIDTSEGYEIASFRAIEYDTDKWKLIDVQRGCFDTLPKNINDGDKIFFTYYGGAINGSNDLNIGTTYKINALTKVDKNNIIDINDTPDINHNVKNRYNLPIAPAGLKINGNYFSDSIGFVDLNLAWFYRNKENQNILKSYLVDDESTLESGTSYILNIYDPSDTLIKTETLTSKNYTFTDEKVINPSGDYYPSLRVELYSINGTDESFERYNITVTRS